MIEFLDVDFGEMFVVDFVGHMRQKMFQIIKHICYLQIIILQFCEPFENVVFIKFNSRTTFDPFFVSTYNTQV